MACDVFLGTFEHFLITDAEQPSHCCRAGIYVPCWPDGVAGWMTGFVGATQHLRVGAEGRMRGSLSAVRGGCIPGVDDALSKTHGHRHDELRIRDFCWWGHQSCQKVISGFWVRVFHASVQSASESCCCVLFQKAGAVAICMPP